jgi:hypothetical protein
MVSYRARASQLRTADYTSVIEIPEEVRELHDVTIRVRSAERLAVRCHQLEAQHGKS